MSFREFFKSFGIAIWLRIYVLNFQLHNVKCIYDFEVLTILTNVVLMKIIFDAPFLNYEKPDTIHIDLISDEILLKTFKIGRCLRRSLVLPYSYLDPYKRFLKSCN